MRSDQGMSQRPLGTSDKRKYLAAMLHFLMILPSLVLICRLHCPRKGNGEFFIRLFWRVRPKLAIKKFLTGTINKALREAILCQDFLDANNFFMKIVV